MVIFQFSPQKFGIQTWFCNCPQISWLTSHWRWVHTKYTWSRKDVGSLTSTSLLSTFHIRSMFCFFPANLMSSTYTDKNNPFSRCTNRHSQLETFSQPCFNEIFSNCLSHNSPAKGWPYRFRSRGRLDLPYWTIILAISVVEKRIQMSGHSDLGIFNKFWSIFHFHLGISRYCVNCLSCAAPQQSGNDMHDSCCCHLRCWWSLFCKCCIRSRIIFHNIASEYNLTFAFSNSAFFKWQMSISEAKWTFAPYALASSITSFFWLESSQTPESFPISPIPHPLLLSLSGIFIAWGKGINLCTKL